MNCIINCVTNSDETSNHMANIISLLSFIVAFAAVYYSVVVARMYIRSNSRQNWINQLRDELIDILAIIDYFPSAYANRSTSPEEAITVEPRKFIEKSQAIKLLINPIEQKHQELINYIDNTNALLVKFINLHDPNYENLNFSPHSSCEEPDSIENSKKIKKELENLKDRILKKSQEIFKEEWERVKKGK